MSDVAIAADKGATAYGPEHCGFVILEALGRLRDVGGGVIDGYALAIGTQGHVALTAPPVPSRNEAESVAALRSLLGALLQFATSTTPALRQCARRDDPRATLATLERELLAALIPLNRQANRRGLARLARTTLEACEMGSLDGAKDLLPQAGESVEPSPVPVVRHVRSTPPPLPIRAATPTPAPAVRPQEVDEPTVQQPPVMFDEPTPSPMDALAEALDDLDAHDDGDLEVVSQLPPLVAATAEEVPTPLDGPRVAVAVTVAEIAPSSEASRPTVSEAARPTVTENDQVRKLVEGFTVSRVRDDRSLSRDLKRMVDIETSVPPGVAAVREEAPPVDLDFGEPSPLPSAAEPPPEPPMDRRGPSAFLAFALAAAAFAVAMIASRPGALSALFGPSSAPPGVAQGAAVPVAAPVPSTPASCEGTLVVENVPKDAELLRRIGVAPSSVVVSIAAPLDLVATLDGHAPKRLRLDKAVFKGDATGLSAQASFALDPLTDKAWPLSASAVSPMRASEPRAVLRLASTPASANVWAVVDAAAVPAPCGVPVDLLVVSRPQPPSVASERKTHRVEWSAFSGSPPHASFRLP